MILKILKAMDRESQQISSSHFTFHVTHSLREFGNHVRMPEANGPQERRFHRPVVIAQLVVFQLREWTETHDQRGVIQHGRHGGA